MHLSNGGMSDNLFPPWKSLALDPILEQRTPVTLETSGLMSHDSNLKATWVTFLGGTSHQHTSAIACARILATESTITIFDVVQDLKSALEELLRTCSVIHKACGSEAKPA